MTDHWININKHTIASNRKHCRREPPVRFQKGKSGKPEYCNVLAILDAQGNTVAEVITSHDGPVLKCGARVAIRAVHGVKPVS